MPKYAILPGLVAAVGACAPRPGSRRCRQVMYSSHWAVSSASSSRHCRRRRHRADQFDEVQELMGTERVGSGTPPQLTLMRSGRRSRGPMPSRQLYRSAKQPPGQRTIGTLIFRAPRRRRGGCRGVGDLRVRADPDATVDAGAEVFGKLAIDVPVDYVAAASSARMVKLVSAADIPATTPAREIANNAALVQVPKFSSFVFPHFFVSDTYEPITVMPSQNIPTLPP